jgi:hypothetical protein
MRFSPGILKSKIETPVDRQPGAAGMPLGQPKLQAALNHGWDHPDQDFLVEYLQACRLWFASLSVRDRAIAESAVWVYASGDEMIAEKIAADLRAAPRCPTLG